MLHLALLFAFIILTGVGITAVYDAVYGRYERE
jgi:hypothetical protein